MGTAEKEIEKNSHSAAQLEDYLKRKAKKHIYFKLYGTEDKLRVIYEEKKLYLSCGKTWNDLKDQEQFTRSDGHTYYARCFSFSKSENVAMWMLYGGMNDNGVMVSFSQKFMNELTEKIDHISLGSFQNNQFGETLRLEKDNFELYLIDMLYVREGEETKAGSYHVKRHDETGSVLDIVVDSIPLCCKHYEWNYENECRLILNVKREIDITKYSDAEIDFSGIDEKIVPKSKDITITPKHQGDPPHDYKKSSLSDGLQWDLCHDCKCKKATPSFRTERKRSE